MTWDSDGSRIDDNEWAGDRTRELDGDDWGLPSALDRVNIAWLVDRYPIAKHLLLVRMVTAGPEVCKLSAETIAKINDKSRSSLGLGSSIPGRMVTSAGIDALLPVHRDAIFTKVRAFNDFRAHNDFSGQHEFGDFNYKGRRIFWQIDCFAPA
jgi:Protein of unknown function (DUF3768)